ncbi:TPA: hypothetical protein ACQZCB_004538, partial [Escherichia coli]
MIHHDESFVDPLCDLRRFKQSGSDPFAAIEAVMPWDTFAASVTEAQTLARPADFDFLHHIGESYATLRR